MVATWIDTEESSSDEEVQKVVNLYLMAQEEKITSETKLDFTFDELKKAFYDLIDELKKLGLKN